MRCAARRFASNSKPASRARGAATKRISSQPPWWANKAASALTGLSLPEEQGRKEMG